MADNRVDRPASGTRNSCWFLPIRRPRAKRWPAAGTSPVTHSN